MASVRKIARRSFLIGSSVIAGGVAFGGYKLGKPPANPLLDSAGEGEAALNAWIKIDQNGITLITPHIEIGQGSKNMQALLICEELDVELDQVLTDQGQPAQAYWNGALAPETAEYFAKSDRGVAYDALHNLTRLGLRAAGMQITGGSTSTPNSFHRLRQAGASARETLKATAAKRTGEDISNLKTEAGAVIMPDGSRLLYTELAEDAAREKVVQNVPLRDPSEWRLIGKKNERIDIPPKVTGKPIFGIDVDLEGMVHAVAKRNPYKGAGVISYDAETAKSMPGVIDVVPITGGVAVIANNTWRAMKALETIDFEWEKGDYPEEQDAHWEKLEAALKNENYNSRKRDDGDVEAALKEGEIISAQYRAPYLAHATLEPLNATVLIEDDRAEVWIGSQAPASAQAAVAKIAGLDKEKVHMNITYAGGGFGIRSKVDPEAIAAEIAVQMKGTPVQLTFTREEDFTQAATRQIAMATLRGRADAQGIQAMDFSLAMPSPMGTNNPSIPDPQIPASAWAEPLSIPNFRVTGYSVADLAPVYFWRAVGASSNGFLFNSALDELMVAGNLDPLEERLRLCNKEIARKVLEEVGALSNWNGRSLGQNRARGLAFSYAFGVHCAQVIDVQMTDQGIKLDRVYVALDVGQIVDPVNFENQVQGGVVWSLGHAMNCETTYANGHVEQLNYHQYEAMRLHQCPEILVKGLENDTHVRGVGEASVPPAPAALANAIFALTGERLREMPFNKFVDFV